MIPSAGWRAEGPLCAQRKACGPVPLEQYKAWSQQVNGHLCRSHNELFAAEHPWLPPWGPLLLHYLVPMPRMAEKLALQGMGRDCGMGIRRESRQKHTFCGILFLEPALGYIFHLKYALLSLTKSFQF